ncbi:MAG: hypothetical protein O7E52_04870, partial [Candidatus Poribacteria bacterium]|nr:hypothetical protein [Candidatus Poribacteria bacterium]
MNYNLFAERINYKTFTVFMNFMLLMFVPPTVVRAEEADTSDDTDFLAALSEPEEAPSDLNQSKVKITGFVDMGWIYPNFRADEPKNSDHHYAESGNAQNTVNKLDARTFSVNEVNFDFNISYNEYITSKASVFIYPTTRTNRLPAYSSLQRDQDIPRDAGPDGVFGTDDDIVGGDTAVDPGDGLNRVVVGVKQAYIDFAYPGSLNAFLRVGKVPSLLGIEQEIFQSPDLPSVATSAIGAFSYGYPQGIQIRGFLNLLSDDDLEFGLGLTHDANGRFNVFPGDATRNLPFALANDNLVFTGRLAFSHGLRNRFTLGASGQTGEKGVEDGINDGSFSSFHPFAKIRLDPSNNPNIGPFRIRAEYLLMDIDNRTGAHPNRANEKTEKYDFLFKPQIDLDDPSNDPSNEDGDVQHEGFYVYLYLDLIKRLTLTLGHSRIDSDIVESSDPALTERFFAWGFRRTQIAARYKILPPRSTLHRE